MSEDDLNKITTLVGYLKPLYESLDVFEQNNRWHFLPALIEEAEEWLAELRPQGDKK